jgi:hypothetical protein
MFEKVSGEVICTSTRNGKVCGFLRYHNNSYPVDGVHGYFEKEK